MHILQSDIFIAGGGLGGCAAALRAAEWGCTVILAEACDWIGGQAVSQGVSALDEHEWIETFGGTASYYRFRSAIRRHYRSLALQDKDNPHFNPGGCWVSRLAFEPPVGLAVLQGMLAPYLRTGQVQLLTRHGLRRARVERERIREVILAPEEGGAELACRSACYIDASELGDLLPLAGVPVVTGAEARSDTGEPHAPAEAHPEWMQSFTFPFIVAFCPGENHTIPKPPGYEENRLHQPYSLAAGKGAQGRPLIYRVFAQTPGTPGSFWTYRRLIEAEKFRPEIYPHDLSLINWHSNDYRGAPLVGVSAAARRQALAGARALSLGFLYWLQTEAPRDEGGLGYPELQLRPELMGSADGLAQFPYIRESRRIAALTRLCEQDIAAEMQPHARARLFSDSVAIGNYWIDIHKSGGEEADLFSDTRPFQIPLGALLPQGCTNLIAGAKNIGTTHITNGACRLHPVEWAIGEAAGALAAESLRRQCTPVEIHARPAARLALQLRMAESGTPLFWFIDVGQTHPAFAALQWLAVAGIITAEPESLLFNPEAQLDAETASAWLEAAGEWWGIRQRVWPRAAAKAERPWHPLAALAQDGSQKGMTRARFALALFESLKGLLHSLHEAHA